MESKNTCIEDLYFLELTDDFVVVNDRYQGLLVMDCTMQIVKKIFIMDDLLIDSAITHENKLILFCYDNECIVFVNLEDDDKPVLRIEMTVDGYFLPLFIWEKESVLLCVGQGTQLVRIDLQNALMYEVKEGNSQLSSDVNEVSRMKVYRFYPNSHQVLANRDGNVCIFNYRTNECKELGINIVDNDEGVPSYMLYHATESVEDVLIRISEMRVNVLTANKSLFIYPHKEIFRFICGRATVVDGKKTLYILSYDNSSEEPTILSRFVIDF